MKNSIKSKLLVMLTLGAACVSDVYASEWVGERMDYGYPYYLFDCSRNKDDAFLSHDVLNDKTYPAYSTYEYADFFMAVQGGRKSVLSSDYYMRLKNVNLSTSNGIFLYSNKTTLSEYSSIARDFEKGYEGTGNFTFNIWYDGGFGSKNYGLVGTVHTQDGDGGKKIVVFTESSNNNFAKIWKFISPEQYVGRPKLDAIVANVESQWPNGDGMPDAVKEQYDAAKAAQIATPDKREALGPQITSSYQSLTNAYNNYLYGESNPAFVENYDQLVQIIIMTEKAVFQQAADGQIPTSLIEALQSAQTVLNGNADGTSEATKNIQDAIAALSAEAAKYTGPVFAYCRYMKELSESIGYPFPQTQKTGLMDLIAKNASENDVNTFIQGVQDDFKAWVNARVANGYGFPKNTDFTAFILNNSFEMGNKSFWSETNAGTVQQTNNVYVYNYSSGNKSNTLSQEISGLPAGTYKLDVTLIQGSIAVKVAGQNVERSGFTVQNGQVVTIQVAGNNIQVDDFKLTLLDGAATQMTFDEAKGFPMPETEITNNAVSYKVGTLLEGPYSSVSATRVIKYNANGQWNTLCLPFALSKDQKKQYFSVVKVIDHISYANQTVTIHYADVAEDSDLTAGEAYLVQVAGSQNLGSLSTGAEGSIVTAPLSTIHETQEGGYKLTMTGNFDCYANVGQSLYNSAYSTYLMQSNAFHIVDAEHTTVAMKAFRAYFMVAEPEGQQASSLRLLYAEVDSSSNIETHVSVNPASDQVFDLMGRNANINARGLYIQQGKKFIVK